MEDVGHILSRLMWIDCVRYEIKFWVVSAYALTEKGSQNQKDNFYKELWVLCGWEKKTVGDLWWHERYCWILYEFCWRHQLYTFEC